MADHRHTFGWPTGAACGKLNISLQTELRDDAEALVSASRLTGLAGEYDIDILPHQMRMAERIWDSGCNCILADPPGSGKQFIMMDVVARHLRKDPKARILILAPVSTIPQIQDDFDKKFGLDFDVYDEDFSVRHDKKWKNHNHVIVSIDKAKPRGQVDGTEGDRGHFARIKNAGEWDLIAIDEAHHVASQHTDRHQLAVAARKMTKRFLLVTATPHQGDRNGFRSLLKLARPDLTEEIDRSPVSATVVTQIVFRTPQADIIGQNGRLALTEQLVHMVHVQPTAERAALEEKLEAFLQRLETFLPDNDDSVMGYAHLLASSYRKVAASSSSALLGMLERRIGRLETGAASAVANATVGLSELDLEGAEETAIDSPEVQPGELDQLHELTRFCREANGKDAKLVALENLIGQIVLKHRGKVVIFTEYLDTQDMIVRELSCYSGIGVAKIRGGMKPIEFHGEIELFNGPANILVCTDVASEGLNLHHHCSTIVHYDCHWNAQRLEQRNGRVHRYGQLKPVNVYILHGDGTHDWRIRDVEEAGLEAACMDLAPISPEFDYRSRRTTVLGDASKRGDLCTMLASHAGEKPADRDLKEERVVVHQRSQGADGGRSSTALPDICDRTASYPSAATTADIMRFIAKIGPFASLGVRIINALTEQFELDFCRWPMRRYREFGGADIVVVTTNRKIANTEGENVVLLLFESDLVQDLVSLALRGMPPALPHVLHSEL
jgi:ERCC4-related helicase